jgi:hypothetical protein
MVEVDPAGDRQRPAGQAVGREQLDGARCRCGHDLSVAVDPHQVPPGPSRQRCPDEVGYRRVAEQVLGHEVVGGDDRSSALAGGRQHTAADPEVRLNMDHVRPQSFEQWLDGPGCPPWCADPERGMERCAQRRNPVHGDDTVRVGTCRRAGLWADHVHVVPTAGEPPREAVGEVRRPVDVRWEGVGADDDPQSGAV